MVRAGSIGKPPMPIVSHLVTVKGNADLDVVIGEELADVAGEQHPVGLQVQIEVGHLADDGSQLTEDSAEYDAPDE